MILLWQSKKKHTSTHKQKLLQSPTVYAGVAELVDAPDSKSGDGNIVSVRVRPSVPTNFFIDMAIQKPSKSLLTNIIALLILTAGFFLGNHYLFAMGSYALSGAITNWLAIYMLFDKIPFLYGSGVIPNRFEEFKKGIKSLIMEQFFTQDNVERFFQESTENDIHHIDIDPLLALIDYDQLFDSLIDSIEQSSLGSMFSLVGGRKVLAPIKQPFQTKLQEKLRTLSELPDFAQILAQQHTLFHPEKVIEKVAYIVDQRLNELTPIMVKIIIQNMIRHHLGWLVIWGGIFGAIIGFLASILPH